MRPGRVVCDYAGDNYKRRNGATACKKNTDNCDTYRCRDCSKLRFVRPYEWTRAKKPHCLDCGGPLIEIERSARRKLGTKRERNLRQNDMLESIREAVVKPQCWACGARFDSKFGLSIHIDIDSDCAKQYVLSGKYVLRKNYSGETVKVFDGTD